MMLPLQNKKKISWLLLMASGIFFFGILNAQTVTLSGIVVGNDEVEGIQVINESTKKIALTNRKGGFKIDAKLNDVIIFLSIAYQPKEVVITKQHMDSKYIMVELETFINRLDEVVVGKALSGDLSADVKNSNVKAPVNFYDLGIPGYTGIPKTQVERKLHEADGGSYVTSVGSANMGAGAGFNLYKILNAISGRTKMLKSHVKFEKAKTCMEKAIIDYSEILFEKETLEEHQKAEFFYFVSEDDKFSQLCKADQELLILQFLKDKLVVYKSNLQSRND